MASRPNLDDKPEDIQADLQAFASLWASLRAKYEGTNITKTIARLLHMYQPEDGVHAYERLLKTVFVLLEDFDVNGLRLLASMVPLPKNVPEETVKDIFLKATGFPRLEAPMFHQNQSLIPAVVNPTNDAKKGEGRECKSTISNTSASITSNNVNKTMTDWHHLSQAISQEFVSPRGFSPAETDFMMNRSSQKIDYYASNSDQVLVDPGNVSQGYKMNWIPSSFMVQNGNPALSNSCGDFLVKTEDNKFVRVPMANVGILMSCNSQNMQSYNPYQLVPLHRPNYLSEKNDAPSTLTSPQNAPATEKSFPVEKIDSKELKAKCYDENNEISMLDNLTASKNLEISIERFLTRVKNNVDSQIKRINPALRRAGVSSNERTEFSHPKDFNYSLSDANDWGKNYHVKNWDLALYKRQYYDSLLNFQRAKAATNPLAPMPSPSAYDSSYYEYLQQQQWIYQHQQRLIMGHQYAQRLIQPEFSALRNPYTRSNEWMSHCPTTRNSQEAYGISPAYYSPNYPPPYDAMTKTNNQSSKIPPEQKNNILPQQNPKWKETGSNNEF